ncbi:MAG: ribosome recycling factor [Pseudomonadota bacterium]|jgi:ribosome recycling factor|nr:ribosome recycling factor [Pseudomonadota bacterium]
MIDELKKEASQKMTKSMESLSNNLSKIRTGRAHPSILDAITVEYYGQEVPLNQVANIKIEDAKTLQLNVWEKNMIKEVEKSVISSDLGLNPAVSGNLIRIPLPPLTEERRKELVKLVKQEGENCKVSVRNIRRDANNKLKQLLKEKSISEDDEKRSEEDIQKLTDSNIKQIDERIIEKEKDLMQI